MSVDIITLDNELKRALKDKSRLPKLRNDLEQIGKLLGERDTGACQHLNKVRETIERQISDLESGRTFKMYLLETVEIIEKYTKLLKRPIQMSFMGPVKPDNSEKHQIIKDYLMIYAKYGNASDAQRALPEENKKNANASDQPLCANSGCGSRDFDVIDQTTICNKCFAVQSSLTNPTSSYSDIDRINIASKYLYDRKIHFRDCILQFQGRQNVTIDKSVYEALENEFDKHHLLIGDAATPNHIRFCQITKDHISIFLKELRLSKHYENVQLIHYNLTGKPPPDIAHLEGKLLQDFENLTALYDQIHKKDTRKNFINTQYVLFQLLRRHKFDCDPSEFSILKTSERRDWHYSICKNLFSILNWNFTVI